MTLKIFKLKKYYQSNPLHPLQDSLLNFLDVTVSTAGQKYYLKRLFHASKENLDTNNHIYMILSIQTGKC